MSAMTMVFQEILRVIGRVGELAGESKGQESFVLCTRRTVPTNDPCLLFDQQMNTLWVGLSTGPPTAEILRVTGPLAAGLRRTKRLRAA
jgi:hypothetical protein